MTHKVCQLWGKVSPTERSRNSLANATKLHLQGGGGARLVNLLEFRAGICHIYLSFLNQKNVDN
jgi:hypothetical protein